MWRAEPSIEGEDQRLARTSSQGLRYGVPGRGRNEGNKHPQCQWENSYHRYFFAYVHILFRKLQQVLKIFSNYQIHHLNSFYIKTSFQFMYESLWKVCFSFLVTIQCTVFQRFSFWSLKWAYGSSWLPTSGLGVVIMLVVMKPGIWSPGRENTRGAGDRWCMRGWGWTPWGEGCAEWCVYTVTHFRYRGWEITS